MRKALALILIAALPLYAAMTTTAAKKKAQQLWGPTGCVTTIEQTGQTVIKSVGICPLNCATPYIEFGRGPSDFSAAFADADMHPPTIAGPFKGTIPLHIVSRDDDEVASLMVIIDGVERRITPTLPVGSVWDLLTSIDTTTLSSGIHTLCKKPFDKQANFGVSSAVLFRVDQATGTTVEWGPPTELFRLKPPYQPGIYVAPTPPIVIPPPAIDPPPVVPPTTSLTAVFLGQSMEDYTSKNGIASPNGINDWQIHVKGLKGIPTGIEIHKYQGGDWVWPSNNFNWPIYAKLAPVSDGDFYIEPFDVAGKFQVIIKYGDGTQEQTDTQ